MSSSISKGVALITGASQGIGRAIALRLANDGFDIAVNDLPSQREALDEVKREISGKGRRAFAIIADVSSEREVQQMVANVVQELGGLDMVANAGIAPVGNTLQISLGDWERTFAVNVRGTYLCYKYAGEQMVKQGRGGRIIGASSAAGKRGYGHMAAYTASKFAIRGLTQATADDFLKYGITVNAYAPGPIDTVLLKTIQDKLPPISAESSAAIALPRIGAPEDIAALVSYLASKEAVFITGQSVSVNGGLFFD